MTLAGHYRSAPACTNSFQSPFSERDDAALASLAGVALAILVRGFDSNAAPRQCLSKKNLDFGIDAPQVRRGATLYRLENRFLSPERKWNAFRSGRPTSLSHDRSRIQGASIDHRGDL